MFNGYHEPSAASFNDLELDKGKKSQNTPNWSCGNGANIQATHLHHQTQQSEIWMSKPPFIGLPNAAHPKCNCPSCYQLPENQGYQGDLSWHRSWLSRTYPVPVNATHDLVKLQANHHWENTNLPSETYVEPVGSQYVQEAGDKSMLYKSYSGLRNAEIYQPGVISAVKKIQRKQEIPKQDELMPEVGHHARFPASIPTSGYDTYRSTIDRCLLGEGSNQCNQNEKFLNAESCRQQGGMGSYNLDPNRRAILDSVSKTVPSNMSQNRVPSLGHRNIKDSEFHTYIDQNDIGRAGSYSANHVAAEEKHYKALYQSDINLGQENLHTSLRNSFSSAAVDYHGINVNRDLSNTMDKDFQKFVNGRNPQYINRNNFPDMLKRNGPNIMMGYNVNRKGVINPPNGRPVQTPPKRMEIGVNKPTNCGISGKISPDQKLVVNHNAPKIPADGFHRGSEIPGNDLFFQGSVSRPKIETNIPEKLFNCVSLQNTMYQGCRKPEYSYGRRSVQGPCDYPNGMINMRSEVPVSVNPGGMANFPDLRKGIDVYPYLNNNFTHDGSSHQFEKVHYEMSGDNKPQSSLFLGPQVSLAVENFRETEKENSNKISHLESIPYEELCKSGTSKISPLRLLRKKKMIHQKKDETSEAPTVDTVPKNTTPPLDVRRFWATWAEEEEENIPQTQMVVLDCHNIDPEQAGLLHLYDSESIRTVNLEDGNLLDVKSSVDKTSDQVESVTSRHSDMSEKIKICAETEKLDILRDLVKKPINDVIDSGGSGKNSSVPDFSLSIPEIIDTVREVTPGAESKSNVIVQGNHFKKVVQKNHPTQDLKQSVMFRYIEKNVNGDQSERHRYSDYDGSEINPVLKKDNWESKLPDDSTGEKTTRDTVRVVKDPDEGIGNSENAENEMAVGSDTSDDSQNEELVSLPDLPTSEYRKNKFLDYSEDNLCNGVFLLENIVTNANKEISFAKKDSYRYNHDEDKVKDCLISTPTEAGPGNFEIDEILKKLSDINFQSPDVPAKSPEPLNDTPEKYKTDKKILEFRKDKKTKKLSHKSSRTDQVTLQNISLTKPTIKFSIQKSHDLKISFKVLNNKKKYEKGSMEADEEVSGDSNEPGNSSESAEDKDFMERVRKNKRRLITLKLKGVSEGNDHEKTLWDDDSVKKSKKTVKKKKARADKSSSPKTPVLKIKKSRYMVKYGCVENELSEARIKQNAAENVSKGSESEGVNHGDFQVHETVDSAKIKLTFKRNKASSEKKYFNENDDMFEVKTRTTKPEDINTTKTSLCLSSTDHEKVPADYESSISPAVECVKHEKDELNIENPIVDSTVKEDDYIYSIDSEFMDEGSQYECIAESAELVKCPCSPVEDIIEELKKEDPLADTEHNEHSVDINEDQLDCFDEMKPPEKDIPWNISETDDCEEAISVSKEEKLLTSPVQCRTTDPEDLNVRKGEESMVEYIPDDSVMVEEESSKKSQEVISVNEIVDISRSSPTEDDEPNVNECFTTMEVEAMAETDSANDSLYCGEKVQSNDDAKGSPQCMEINHEVEGENVRNHSNPLYQPEVTDTTKEETLFVDTNYLQCGEDPQTEKDIVEGYNSDISLNREDITRKPEDKTDVSQENKINEEIEVNSTCSPQPNTSEMVTSKVETDISASETNTPVKAASNSEFSGHDISSECHEAEKDEESNESHHYRSDIVGEVKRCTSFEMNDVTSNDPICSNEIQSNCERNTAQCVQSVTSDVDENNSTLDQYVPYEHDIIFPRQNVDDGQTKGVETKIVTSSQETCDVTENDTEDEKIIGENNNNIYLLPRETFFVKRKILRRCSCEEKIRRQDFRYAKLRKRSMSLNIKLSVMESDIMECIEPEIPVLDIPVSDIPLPPGEAPPENCLNLEEYLKFKLLKAEGESTFQNETSQTNQFVPSKLFSDDLKSFPEGKEQEKQEPELCEKAETFDFPPDATEMSTEKDNEKGDVEKDQPEASDETSVEKVDSVENQLPEETVAINVEEETLTDPSAVTEMDQKGEPRLMDISGIETCKDPLEETETFIEDLEIFETTDTKIEETSFSADQLYECEGLVFDGSLTITDDMEDEKVSDDDKFRDIMQNCLENAKKFLSVGNLKLPSCPTDNLLDIDHQPESENSDVTKGELTTCENGGLVDNGNQPLKTSVDIVPSFCSDVGSNPCSEILPVDNWPYLEEEVMSSPMRNKSEETDLLVCLERSSSTEISLPEREIPEKPQKRLRGVSLSVTDTSKKKNTLTDGTATRSITHRRRTIEGIGQWEKFYNSDEEPPKSGRFTFTDHKEKFDIEMLSKKILRYTAKSGEMKKRMSPYSDSEKFGEDTSKSSYQPKMVLFRISNNMIEDLSTLPKKNKDTDVRESPLFHKTNNLDGQKMEITTGNGEKYKQFKNGNELISTSHGTESTRDVISAADKHVGIRSDGIKRKKNRFRNLHTKKRIVPDKLDLTKENKLTAQNSSNLVDSESDSDESSDPPKEFQYSHSKSTKLSSSVKSDEKSKEYNVPSRVSVSKKEQETSNTRKYDECRRSSDRRDSVKYTDRSRDNKRKRGPHENENQYKKERYRSRERTHSSDLRKSSEGQRDNGEKSKWDADKNLKNRRESEKHRSWICEVCGFSKTSERATHIQTHPFHCQSCHLAFKTETNFIEHLTRKHKDIRNQHHCLLCELSFDMEKDYYCHLETREHKHLESVEKNTINTLFTLLTGHPCPVLGPVESKPEWLPSQAGTVHFYHQATPLSLALQYLKLHHDKKKLLNAALSPRSE